VSPTKPQSARERFDGGRATTDRLYNEARKHTPHDKAIRSRRWRKVREIQLTKHPLCHDCEENGRTTVATEVHHVVQRAVDLGGTFDLENLLSLCTACHAKRSAEERRPRS